MEKVFFDSRLCMGCRSCEFACAVEHSESKEAVSAIRQKDRPVPRRRVEMVEGMILTVACRHCQRPACVDACIAGAMIKDPITGEVSCDSDKCVGCWMCVMVCPFDAVQTGLACSLKCDMCKDRDTPACVEACPTGALFEAPPERLQEILRQKRGAETKVAVRR